MPLTRRSAPLLGAALALSASIAGAQSGGSTAFTPVVTAQGTWFFGRDVASCSLVGCFTSQANRVNSTAAFTAFQSGFTSLGVQNFEGVGTGSVPYSPTGATGTNIGFSGSANITGRLSDVESNFFGNSGQVRVVDAPSAFNLYSVAPSGSDGSRFVRAEDDMMLKFFNSNSADPLRGFGFWGIDVGEWNRDLTVKLRDGASTVDAKFIDDFPAFGAGAGNVFFIGFIANGGVEIDNAIFDRTQNSGFCNDVEAPCLIPDAFGYDYMVVGAQSQLAMTATPEPATLLLLGTGLAAVAGLGLRRRRKQHTA